jgi:hypothetical protein
MIDKRGIAGLFVLILIIVITIAVLVPKNNDDNDVNEGYSGTDKDMGVPWNRQPKKTVQIINDTNDNLVIGLKNTLNKFDWTYNDKTKLGGKHGAVEASALDHSPEYPIVHLRRGEFIILNVPISGKGGQAWRIVPMKDCHVEGGKVKCKVGGNPTAAKGTYGGNQHGFTNWDSNSGWDNEWPSGGGYTICRDPPCDTKNPTAGTTVLECGTDMVCDMSAVDGYSYGAHLTVTAGPAPPGDCKGDGCGQRTDIEFRPNRCEYGIRNYGEDKNKGLIGCTNTMKDGVFNRKITPSEWPHQTASGLTGHFPGHCNIYDVSNPTEDDWKSGCYAPSKKYCEDVHRGQSINPAIGDFSTYCFSHDDHNSSMIFNPDYKIRLRFTQGIVGQPFREHGCNWTPPTSNITPATPCVPVIPPHPKYKCKNDLGVNFCEMDDGGEYDSMDKCIAHCSNNPNPRDRWGCINGVCINDPLIGEYETKHKCEAVCQLGPVTCPDPNCLYQCSAGQICPDQSICPIYDTDQCTHGCCADQNFHHR